MSKEKNNIIAYGMEETIVRSKVIYAEDVPFAILIAKKICGTDITFAEVRPILYIDGYQYIAPEGIRLACRFFDPIDNFNLIRASARISEDNPGSVVIKIVEARSRITFITVKYQKHLRKNSSILVSTHERDSRLQYRQNPVLRLKFVTQFGDRQFVYRSNHSNDEEDWKYWDYVVNANMYKIQID